MLNSPFPWKTYGETILGYYDIRSNAECSRTDIDYMNQYRDFDNDAIRFNYTTGQQFLATLHANGQHYIPIVDSAIYVPNPANASDA